MANTPYPVDALIKSVQAFGYSCNEFSKAMGEAAKLFPSGLTPPLPDRWYYHVPIVGKKIHADAIRNWYRCAIDRGFNGLTGKWEK